MVAQQQMPEVQNKRHFFGQTKARVNTFWSESTNMMHMHLYSDLWCQKHEGGKVQQTPQLFPGCLPAGGQQGGGWPAAQGHI